MKKSVILGALIAAIVVMGFSFGTTSAANPWDEIKSLIASLQGQVAQLFTKTDSLTTKDTDLQNQIANIQLIPGPQGEIGPQGSQGLPGKSWKKLKVLDANNKLVGVVTDPAATMLASASEDLDLVKDRFPSTDIWNNDFRVTTGVKINLSKFGPMSVYVVGVAPSVPNVIGFLEPECVGQAYLNTSDLYSLYDLRYFGSQDLVLGPNVYYYPKKDVGVLTNLSMVSVKYGYYNFPHTTVRCESGANVPLPVTTFPSAIAVDQLDTNGLYVGPFRYILE